MRILVASQSGALTARIQDVLLNDGHECLVSTSTSASQLTGQLLDDPPDILILALSPDPERALTLLQAKPLPSRVLAIGPGNDARLILRALREGAGNYVEETELEKALREYLLRLRTEVSGQKHAGRFIAVLAASGGCGGSTVAVNLATVLAQKAKSCALFDLKPGVGDLAALLDLKPSYTLADLCQNADHFDPSMFERALVRHASGVALLAPPRRLEDIRLVTPHGVNQAITLARSLFPYVVGDLDDCFHEEQVQAIRLADVVLLVLRLDFTSLRNAQKALEGLEDIGISRDRVQLVINRFGQPRELPAASAEQALKVKISHMLPDDPKTVNRANNNGVPAVLDSPRAAISKSIIRMAESVNGVHT
jgi:pilus assembly protein CpaE